MTFTPTSLNKSYIIELSPSNDSRGWFARTYCKKEFQQIGHNKEWVQLNHSATFKKGSIRGMHYQLRPFREIKMVRCIAGSIYDVIIDLRKNSPTFLQWFGTELSAKNKRMLYIPEGFAHGFQTLSNDSELIYHHTEFYNPKAEAGVKYNDPVVNIQWPLAITEISERDNNHRYLDKNFKGI
jgi:dTDP-4-dehydrorhamnose 3,5-epimerase